MPVEMVGGDAKIAVNEKYLRDAISGIVSNAWESEIAIELTDQARPMTVRPASEPFSHRNLHIVMQTRVNWEDPEWQLNPG